MSKVWNKIIAVVLAITALSSLAMIGASAASIANGNYTVPVALWHETKNQASMGNKAMKQTAKVKVNNGKITMTIYTKGMTYGNTTAYLQEMRVRNGNGGWTQAKVLSRDSKGNPTAFSITLPGKKNYYECQVNPHVKEMGNTYLDARLKVNWNNLKKA